MIFFNFLKDRLIEKGSNAQINLLDIGCSNKVPKHFSRFDKYINYIGCDPDPVGLDRTRIFLKKRKFLRYDLLNVGASNIESKSFLNIEEKRTGSFIVSEEKESTISVDLIETRNLQKKFSNQSANIIKIDCEGHELNVIEGIDFQENSLMIIEVECTINEIKENTIGKIIDKLEKNDFFIGSLRYHNEQTVSEKKFRNKILKKIFIFFGILGFVKLLDRWTDLSGKVDFGLNKSFIKQIEIVFVKQKRFIPFEEIGKYYNCLIIYGFLRYLPSIYKLPNFLRFFIKLLPSR